MLPLVSGSTCIAIQPEPDYDAPYEGESNVEELEDEERGEMDRQTDCIDC